MSKAIAASTTRRDLIVGAAAATTALMAGPKSRMPPQWREFIDQIAFLHPKGREAAMLAYEFRDKIDLAEFSGVVLYDHANKPVPMLIFGDWSAGKVIHVNPKDAWVAEAVPTTWGQS